MSNILIITYGSIAMMVFTTTLCALIGAVSTNINGVHVVGESWQVHFKHMADGFVMAAVISIPAAIFMIDIGTDVGYTFLGLLVVSAGAPNVLRLAKTKGLTGLLNRFGGKK